MNNGSYAAPNQVRSRWIWEGLIITSVPIVAYLLTFAYEAGFASFFSIPLKFISVELTGVFVAGGGLLAVFVSLFFLMELMWMLFPRTDNAIFRCVWRLVPAFLLFVGLLFLYGAHWRGWVLVLVSLVFVAWLELGSPLITQRHTAGYCEKLRAQEEIERKVGGLLAHVAMRYGRAPLLLILYLVIALVIFYSAGRARALRQEQFLLPTAPSGTVVLQIYGDRLICAPFERATKEVRKSFIVLKMPGDSGVILHLEKVGPLSPKEE